jgi:HTH-type transcriptional regulator, glycine betaine synthesis regulator
MSDPAEPIVPTEPKDEAATSLQSRTLAPVELGFVESWMQLADSLGLPKSLAQMYALIFASKRPITAQDCVDALKISRSSAGQGLKSLREIGAIRPALELGARREGFVIEPDLGVLIRGILRNKIEPAFDTFFTQIEPLEKSLDPEKNKFLVNRFQKLQRWRGKINLAAKLLLS